MALGSAIIGITLLTGGVAVGALSGTVSLNTGAVVIGFMGANELLGQIGDAIDPGWRDALQGGFGIVSSLYAGYRDLKGLNPKGKIYREDKYPYSPIGSKSNRLKSYVDSKDNVRPANPNGKATVRDHIRGSEPKKSDSPYTSFKGTKNTGKKYGDQTITVDKAKLQKD